METVKIEIEKNYQEIFIRDDDGIVHDVVLELPDTSDSFYWIDGYENPSLDDEEYQNLYDYAVKAVYEYARNGTDDINVAIASLSLGFLVDEVREATEEELEENPNIYMVAIVGNEKYNLYLETYYNDTILIPY